MDSRTITIIDFQIGNLFSVKHACEHLGFKAEISSDKTSLLKSSAAILPGVGAFGDAMNNLRKFNLLEPIKDFISSGRPFMGICLGMQLLFSESEEFGQHQGLNIIPGKVKKFPSKDSQGIPIRIPQIGWNAIYKNQSIKWTNTPFSHIKEDNYMYFVHSYYTEPEDKERILSYTNYCGIEYCSSILHENVFAAQFHPEKSGKTGIQIYHNWLKNYEKTI